MTIDLRLEGSDFKLNSHSKTISTVHSDRTAGSCNYVTQLQQGIQIENYDSDHYHYRKRVRERQFIEGIECVRRYKMKFIFIGIGECKKIKDIL